MSHHEETEGGLPATCSVAFKEWAGICEAILRGEQSLIFRKGGIAEGPDGFQPEHPCFWLYPTHYHEPQQGLKVDDPVTPPDDLKTDEVDLPGLVLVRELAWVDQLHSLNSLEDLHAWTPETVAKRFHYKRPGIWVLGLQAFRSERSVRIKNTPDHAGCKSWVPLNECLATEGLAMVVDPPTTELVLRRIRGLRPPKGT